LSDPFDSAWMKWHWATEKATALLNEVNAFMITMQGQPVGSMSTDYDAKRHAFVVRVYDLPPFPPSWMLKLGDIAHNFRSSLDHLAWTLVEAGKRPPDTLTEKQQRQVAFPIAKDAREFSKNVDRNLPGVRRADLAILRRYQPYCRGPSKARFQCLTILAWMNNIDKHRDLQPVHSLPTGGTSKVLQMSDCERTTRTTRARSYPLQDGAEVCTIPVRKTGPNPELDVEVQLTTQPSLDNRVPVGVWLTNTFVWINSLLADFAQPPAVLPSP
jgi:hypothetical protein